MVIFQFANSWFPRGYEGFRVIGLPPVIIHFWCRIFEYKSSISASFGMLYSAAWTAATRSFEQKRGTTSGTHGKTMGKPWGNETFNGTYRWNLYGIYWDKYRKKIWWQLTLRHVGRSLMADRFMIAKLVTITQPSRWFTQITIVPSSIHGLDSHQQTFHLGAPPGGNPPCYPSEKIVDENERIKIMWII